MTATPRDAAHAGPALGVGGRLRPVHRGALGRVPPRGTVACRRRGRGRGSRLYVASVHPFAIFGAFAAVLGFIPYLHVPCTPVPLLLVLSVGVWVALAFLPESVPSGRARAVAVVLAAPALLSAVATGMSGHDRSSPRGSRPPRRGARAAPARGRPGDDRAGVRDRHRPRHRARPCSWPSACSPRAPGDDRRVSRGRTNVQRVPGTADTATRLTGTFVEPNIAGLVLGAGLLLAVAYFRGPIRVGAGRGHRRRAVADPQPGRDRHRGGGRRPARAAHSGRQRITSSRRGSWPVSAPWRSPASRHGCSTRSVRVTPAPRARPRLSGVPARHAGALGLGPRLGP